MQERRYLFWCGFGNLLSGRYGRWPSPAYC